MTGKRTEILLAWVLVIVALAKMWAVVLPASLMGYANNFDFIRQSSCTGLWQLYKDDSKVPRSGETPFNALTFTGEKSAKSCMKTADSLFPALATAFHEKGQRVDFREVSVWKAALASFLIVALVAGIGVAAAKLAIALVFFFVFGDLANLLYFNTLYLEYSVILGSFFSLAAAALMLSTSVQPQRGIVTLALFSLAWLGFSKEQYMPLASALSCILALAFFRKWSDKNRGVLFLLLALAIPVGYNYLNPASESYFRNMANKTDTFLSAVLPAARDQRKALAQLNLPQSCASGIGVTWYWPGVQSKHPCPAVGEVGRLILLRLFVLQPSTFFEPMQKGIVETRPLYPAYLAHLEEPSRITSVKHRVLQKSSLTTWLAAVPVEAYLPLSVLSMLCCVVLAIPIVTPAKAGPDAFDAGMFFCCMIGFGGLATLYAVASSVFGDGYEEVQKHAIAFAIGISFQIAALVLMSVNALRRLASRDRRARSQTEGASRK